MSTISTPTLDFSSEFDFDGETLFEKGSATMLRNVIIRVLVFVTASVLVVGAWQPASANTGDVGCTGPLSLSECVNEIVDFSISLSIDLGIGAGSSAISDEFMKDAVRKFGEFALNGWGMLSSVSDYRRAQWNP